MPECVCVVARILYTDPSSRLLPTFSHDFNFPNRVILGRSLYLLHCGHSGFGIVFATRSVGTQHRVVFSVTESKVRGFVFVFTSIHATREQVTVNLRVRQVNGTCSHTTLDSSSILYHYDILDVKYEY